MLISTGRPQIAYLLNRFVRQENKQKPGSQTSRATSFPHGIPSPLIIPVLFDPKQLGSLTHNQI